MKKNIISIVLFVNIILNAFAQMNVSNYANGNGTIIETKIIDNVKWTIRKHNQNVKIGYIEPSAEKRLVVYSNPQLEKNVLFDLNLNDRIKIFEIWKEENNINNIKNIWLKIETHEKIGWINIGDNRFGDPYGNDRWSIIETIITNNKEWTVRKLDTSLSVWNVLYMYDKPGFDSNILFELVPVKNGEWIYFVDGIAITEELDTINNRTDHWVKIKDEHGRIGWIFGGYGDIERGGPKYYTPEEIIYSSLGDH